MSHFSFGVPDIMLTQVPDANFIADGDSGLKLQAMDNSHVALVSVLLRSDGFSNFRCDRPMPLGVNLGSLSKVLKCAKDDDTCVLKAADDADILSFTHEAKSACAPAHPTRAR